MRLSKYLVLVAVLGCGHVTSTRTGVDVTFLDHSVSPCEDFYQFACGGKLKRVDISSGKKWWFSIFDIAARNEERLRGVLEADAAGVGDPRDHDRDKLGDFWAACMDEESIERHSGEELRAELAPIDAASDLVGLATVLATLHLRFGRRDVFRDQQSTPFFSFGPRQDARDSSTVIGTLDQAGLTLPSRDYYVRDEPHFRDRRSAYVAHVAKMFVLAGESQDDAARDAATVVRVERSLAEPQSAIADRQDPVRTYHRMNRASIDTMAPHFPWVSYFTALGVSEPRAINVVSPEFLVGFDRVVASSPLADLKTYLRWHALHDAAPYLGHELASENARFFGSAHAPRWQSCVRYAGSVLGDALAQPFVRETPGDQGRRSATEMLVRIEDALAAELASVSWLSAGAREESLAKLKDVVSHNKVGFPHQWRSYEALPMTRSSLLKNMIAGNLSENRRQLQQIGHPFDHDEWVYSPLTTSGHGGSPPNEVLIAAGLLQRPFFDPSASPAVNYGAIGVVMGHELSHCFDNQGRRFDAHGDLRDTWSPSDQKEFSQRSECLVNQFDSYIAVDDVHVPGRLTLDENIADLVGVRLAYRAFLASATHTSHSGEFSDRQLFFLGLAQALCSKVSPEFARDLVVTNWHAPLKWRVNGPLSNMPEFAAAFGCKAHQKMVRADRCEIW